MTQDQKEFKINLGDSEFIGNKALRTYIHIYETVIEPENFDENDGMIGLCGLMNSTLSKKYYGLKSPEEVGNIYQIPLLKKVIANFLLRQFQNWPKFSGDKAYPIRIDKSIYGFQEYDRASIRRRMWDKSTEYGQARFELAKFVYEQAKIELAKSTTI